MALRSTAPSANTSSPPSPPSSPRSQLRADLSAVNRSKTPWVILGGHKSFYMSPSTNWTAMEPLVREFNVDIALAGHVHNYVSPSGGVLPSRTAGRVLTLSTVLLVSPALGWCRVPRQSVCASHVVSHPSPRRSATPPFCRTTTSL